MFDSRPASWSSAPTLPRFDDHRTAASARRSLLAELAAAVRDEAPASTLVRHLRGLDAVIENHVRYEERELVPLLDALSPADDAPSLTPTRGTPGA